MEKKTILLVEDDEVYYYRARYYSPELQRFISEDPLGLSVVINLYAYVKNNPVILTDPTGKWIVPVVVCAYAIACYWMYFDCMSICRGNNVLKPGDPYPTDCFKICSPILEACGIHEFIWHD